MATLDSVNYAKEKAGSKVAPGEQNGRVKGNYDSYSLGGSVIANNDEIESIKIPEGAIIVDAWLKSPSMGATGIFNLGLRAFEDADEASVAEDADGLVQAADAGGQAVMKRADLTSALIGKKVGKGGARVFVQCSEVTVATSGKVEWFVDYLLP